MKRKFVNLLSLKCLLGIALLAVLMTGFMSKADASHYRYGTLSWKPTGNVKEVEFSGSQVWRNHTVGGGVGSRSNTVGRLYFGDGTFTNMYILITSANASENWYGGNIVNSASQPITHTYTGNGPYKVYWNSCCRVGGLRNYNGNMRMETIVNLTTGNSSPVSTTPAIVNVTVGDPAYTFNVPALDSDGDTLRFRLANGEVIRGSGSFNHPSGLSIDSSGTITWNTTGLTVGHMYDTAVTIEDMNGTTSKSKISVDFLLKIVQDAGTPPAFTNSSSCGVQESANVGNNISFTVSAVDSDSNDTVTIVASGLPTGATFGPTTTTGGTTSGTFSWTPTANDGGAHLIAFTATDSQSHQVICNKPLLVVTNQPPVANCKNVTVYADATCKASGSDTDVDNGSTDPDGAADIASVAQSPSAPYGLGVNNVTLTITDQAGASDQCNATVTVVDRTSPTISVPADVQLDCGDDTSPNNTGNATGTDNCKTIIASYTDSHDPRNCVGKVKEVITRTWIVKDALVGGNSASGDQTITVVDTTPPVLSGVPADVTVECDRVVPPVSTAPTATDNCDSSLNPNYLGEERAVGACPNSYTLTRKWSATDACGNESAIQSQTINVVDTTPPTLNLPADTSVECTDDTSSDSTGKATGTDSCGSVSSVKITETESSVSGSCGDTVVITRTWTATDACGNATSADQIITVVDNTPPTLNLPADTSVECTDDTSSDSTGKATGTDSCGSVSSVKITETESSVSGSCGDTVVITRTWTATDACGNSTSGTQTITVVDTTPPMLEVPEDVNITPSGASSSYTIVSSDTCGGVVLTMDYSCQKRKKDGSLVSKPCEEDSVVLEGNTVTVIESGGVGNIITVTITSTDDCDNFSTKSFVVNVLRGDEGVGNGVDLNTPGHDNNGGNDDPGTGPGNPGAKGGKKNR